MTHLPSQPCVQVLCHVAKLRAPPAARNSCCRRHPTWLPIILHSECPQNPNPHLHTHSYSHTRGGLHPAPSKGPTTQLLESQKAFTFLIISSSPAHLPPQSASVFEPVVPGVVGGTTSLFPPSKAVVRGPQRQDVHSQTLTQRLSDKQGPIYRWSGKWKARFSHRPLNTHSWALFWALYPKRKK